MVPLRLPRFGSTTLGVALALVTPLAAADEPPPSPSAPAGADPAPAPPLPAASPAAPAPVEHVFEHYDDPESRFRHFAVNLNPVALLLGHFSADFQFLPVLHQAIVLSPYGVYANPGTPFASTDLTTMVNYGSAYGAELGYRFYAGERGANGLFLGVGGLLESGHRVNPTENFGATGAFLDLGAQGILGSGLLVGLGFGLQWRIRLDDGLWRFAPRLLVTVGYAF